MQEDLPPYDLSPPLPRYDSVESPVSPVDTIASRLSDYFQQGQYDYRSGPLHINLGPSSWGTRVPVYGFQAVVEGTVRFAKKCTHVMRVTATLEGKVLITASRGGSVAAASDKLILSQSTTLFQASDANSSGGASPKPSATLFGGRFDLSLPFPTYISEGRDPLPPSQSLTQQGTYCTINYTLRVDVIRKGLRRHERVTIPIMYLPRSTPPNQVPLAGNYNPLPCYGSEQDLFTTVDLGSSQSARTALKKLQMSAQLTLPSPKIYTSGDSIPLILTLSCSNLPSLPQLLAKVDSLSVHLIRRSKIMMNSDDSLQETIVSKAELTHTDNCSEGLSSLFWTLQLGKNQRHISWKVDGSAEVKHFIRVVFKPLPCSVVKELPAFQHDEVVKLTSDPWFEPVIADELRHLPSLGLAPVGLTTDQLARPGSPLSPSTRL